MQAFYREGIALQCLGRFADALAAFAAGLGLDSKNVQLLSGLVDAASKSPLKGQLRTSGYPDTDRTPSQCLILAGN